MYFSWNEVTIYNGTLHKSCNYSKKDFFVCSTTELPFLQRVGFEPTTLRLRSNSFLRQWFCLNRKSKIRKRNGACLAGIEPDNLAGISNFIIPLLIGDEVTLIYDIFLFFYKFNKVKSEKRHILLYRWATFPFFEILGGNDGIRTHDLVGWSEVTHFYDTC